MVTSLISFPYLCSNSVSPRHLPTVERGPSTSFQGTKCLTDVGTEGPKLIVVENWLDELKRLVPAGK